MNRVFLRLSFLSFNLFVHYKEDSCLYKFKITVSIILIKRSLNYMDYLILFFSSWKFVEYYILETKLKKPV